MGRTALWKRASLVFSTNWDVAVCHLPLYLGLAQVRINRFAFHLIGQGAEMGEF